MVVEEHLDLVLEVRTRRVRVGGHLEHGIGEIRGAVLDVVEQPTYEAVLQCLSVHRSSSGTALPSCTRARQ